MKQLIQKILFGKPVTGIPVKYGEVHVEKTTTPWNVDYRQWKDCVTEFGYQQYINFLQRMEIKKRHDRRL